MKKLSTLFVVNYENNVPHITRKVRPENEWVYKEKNVKATRKFDGTACIIINCQIYKRYDVKKGKPVPLNSISCQAPDPITGHWPHWVLCDRNKPEDQYFFEGVSNLSAYSFYEEDGSLTFYDGTYELCGPKIGTNPEKKAEHVLIKHGREVLDIVDFSFSSIKHYLSDPANDIEGIVFHGEDGKMCKIRKKDFKVKR
ncbi:MAG: hypothetical protein WC679_01510 [Bacteroidales bacterium]|jgi:hypothetical protein